MIQLLIVDPTRLMCTLVATALQNEADMQVVDMTQDVATALAKAGNCDIILVSAHLPDGAFELTRQLKAQGKKVVITGLVESQPLIVSYLEAGAAGYTLRDSSAEELIDTIRAVHRDEALVSPVVGMALVERMKDLLVLARNVEPEPMPATELNDKLSEREIAVLALMADRLSNQQIAEALIIELGTVKNHVHSILKKLNVSSRTQAARCYLSATLHRAPLQDTELRRAER